MPQKMAKIWGKFRGEKTERPKTILKRRL